MLYTLSIKAEDAGDVTILFARSVKAKFMPQTTAPCHQVEAGTLTASVEKYLAGKGTVLALKLFKEAIKIVAHVFKLLWFYFLASVPWLKHVCLEVRSGVGILEALTDQLLVGMECRHTLPTYCINKVIYIYIYI